MFHHTVHQPFSCRWRWCRVRGCRRRRIPPRLQWWPEGWWKVEDWGLRSSCPSLPWNPSLLGGTMINTSPARRTHLIESNTICWWHSLPSLYTHLYCFTSKYPELQRMIKYISRLTFNIMFLRILWGIIDNGRLTGALSIFCIQVEFDWISRVNVRNFKDGNFIGHLRQQLHLPSVVEF